MTTMRCWIGVFVSLAEPDAETLPALKVESKRMNNENKDVIFFKNLMDAPYK